MPTIEVILKNTPSFFSLGGVTLSRINQAENELGLFFSADYRAYLQSFGLASFEGHELTGICDFPRLNVVVITKKLKKHYSNLPNNWYVVEETNVDNVVIWQSSSGEVYQTMPNAEPQYLYPTLSEFIKNRSS